MNKLLPSYNIMEYVAEDCKAIETFSQSLYAVIRVAPHIHIIAITIPPIDISGFKPIWKFGNTNSILYITNIKYGITVKPSAIPIIPPIPVNNKLSIKN